uniref:Cyclophilin TM1367-like domain-containing protein n=1 Tax=Ammonifex degensii TaxID=42838 RepID=A0A7C2I389_9THEO
MKQEEKRRMMITAGDVTVEAELNDSATARAIWEALPLTGTVNTWGDEIYFHIPLTLPPENLQELVEMGAAAYWPDGPALCFFFGPTPVSKGSEIRPASPVNVWGQIQGDARVLKRVRAGEAIKLTRKE